jgi:hypothetical protein
MPPFWYNKNGRVTGAGVAGGGLAGTSISKNLISDQTTKRLASELALTSNWAFDATEGLGVAVNTGGTVGTFQSHGENNDIRVTTEWKFISQAGNGSFGVIGRMPTYLNPDDFYYWVRIYNGNSLRLTTNNGGTVNLDTQAITALVQGEIFELVHEITDTAGVQTHLGTYNPAGRTDNGAGAASYNLSGIAAGADTEIQVAVDGAAAATVTFTAASFGNYAACTPAEVAAVITAATGVRSWAVGNIIYVASDTLGTASILEVSAGLANDANGVLGFTTGAQAADVQTVTANDNTWTYGSIGFRGGFGANTAQWLRNIQVEYLT